MTPVDACASALLSLAARPSGHLVHHVRHGQLLTGDRLAQLLSSAGYPVDPVDATAFAERALARAESDFSSVFGALRDIGGAPEPAETPVACAMTLAELEDAGFRWPIIGEAYFERYLSHVMAGCEKEV